MPTPGEIGSAIKTIEQVALDYGIDDAYFVGGYPRALAMGLDLSDVHDLDVACGSPRRAIELAGFVAEAAGSQDYHIHHRTTTVTMTVDDVEIDFQGSASHEHVAPYVRLWGVEETPISKNIFDRDFTINSLAIKVGSNKILDMTGRGMSDIHDKRIAAIIPPDDVVPKNPLMITRAVRMASRYGFKIEKNLWAAMEKNANQLRHGLSSARLAIEAFVLSKYPQAEKMLEELGIDFLNVPSFVEKGRMMAKAAVEPPAEPQPEQEPVKPLPLGKARQQISKLPKPRPDDMIIPVGTVLFHGSLENFPELELTAGGYDKILWTTGSEYGPAIAQSYIPTAGSTAHISPGSLVYPLYNDDGLRKLQRAIGIIYDYNDPDAIEWDRTGRPQSFRLAKKPDGTTWSLDELTSDKVDELLKNYGFRPKDESSSPGFNHYEIRMKLKNHEFDFMPPNTKATGRLFIITVKQPLRIFDFAKNREGDLTDVDYNKFDVFEKAEKAGYDGIRITDFAQVEGHGNVGHTSIGIFENSIGKLEWKSIPAQHPDFDLNSRTTPEWDEYRKNNPPSGMNM
jgi:hypothetical protein